MAVWSARELPDDTTEKPLYASKFVDLIQDEEALIRKATSWSK